MIRHAKIRILGFHILAQNVKIGNGKMEVSEYSLLLVYGMEEGTESWYLVDGRNSELNRLYVGMNVDAEMNTALFRLFDDCRDEWIDVVPATLYPLGTFTSVK